jgi:NADPH-dependent ferric siderophore reductase
MPGNEALAVGRLEPDAVLKPSSPTSAWFHQARIGQVLQLALHDEEQPTKAM